MCFWCDKVLPNLISSNDSFAANYSALAKASTCNLSELLTKVSILLIAIAYNDYKNGSSKYLPNSKSKRLDAALI